MLDWGCWTPPSSSSAPPARVPKDGESPTTILNDHESLQSNLTEKLSVDTSVDYLVELAQRMGSYSNKYSKYNTSFASDESVITESASEAETRVRVTALLKKEWGLNIEGGALQKLGMSTSVTCYDHGGTMTIMETMADHEETDDFTAEEVTPPPSQKQEAQEEEERAYDDNPTRLFVYLQQRAWGIALAQLQTHPDEARVWVYRKARPDKVKKVPDDGDDQQSKALVAQHTALVVHDHGNELPDKFLWKSLPLHAAIVLGAPTEIIQDIIRAYPNAAKKTDERGSLPVHLATSRLDVDPEGDKVVLQLFGAYPESMEHMDRKGRTPLELAKLALARNEIEGLKLSFPKIFRRIRSHQPQLQSVFETPNKPEEKKTIDKSAWNTEKLVTKTSENDSVTTNTTNTDKPVTTEKLEIKTVANKVVQEQPQSQQEEVTGTAAQSEKEKKTTNESEEQKITDEPTTTEKAENSTIQKPETKTGSVNKKAVVTSTFALSTSGSSKTTLTTNDKKKSPTVSSNRRKKKRQFSRGLLPKCQPPAKKKLSLPLSPLRRQLMPQQRKQPQQQRQQQEQTQEKAEAKKTENEKKSSPASPDRTDVTATSVNPEGNSPVSSASHHARTPPANIITNIDNLATDANVSSCDIFTNTITTASTTSKPQNVMSDDSKNNPKTNITARNNKPKKKKKKGWKEYTDPTSGNKYYSNGFTTTWDRPANFTGNSSSSETKSDGGSSNSQCQEQAELAKESKNEEKTAIPAATAAGKQGTKTSSINSVDAGFISALWSFSTASTATIHSSNKAADAGKTSSIVSSTGISAQLIGSGSLPGVIALTTNGSNSSRVSTSIKKTTSTAGSGSSTVSSKPDERSSSGGVVSTCSKAKKNAKKKPSSKKKMKQQQEKLEPTKFDYFQVVLTKHATDMMVRLPSSPNRTFADLRREIEEDAADNLPFPSFKFTVEAGGMAVCPKQEKKWKLRDYDLMNLGDGSYKHPYRLYIKEAKNDDFNLTTNDEEKMIGESEYEGVMDGIWCIS